MKPSHTVSQHALLVRTSLLSTRRGPSPLHGLAWRCALSGLSLLGCAWHAGMAAEAAAVRAPTGARACIGWARDAGLWWGEHCTRCALPSATRLSCHTHLLLLRPRAAGTHRPPRTPTTAGSPRGAAWLQVDRRGNATAMFASREDMDDALQKVDNSEMKNMRGACVIRVDPDDGGGGGSGGGGYRDDRDRDRRDDRDDRDDRRRRDSRCASPARSCRTGSCPVIGRPMSVSLLQRRQLTISRSVGRVLPVCSAR